MITINNTRVDNGSSQSFSRKPHDSFNIISDSWFNTHGKDLNFFLIQASRPHIHGIVVQFDQTGCIEASISSEVVILQSLLAVFSLYVQLREDKNLLADIV